MRIACATAYSYELDRFEYIAQKSRQEYVGLAFYHGPHHPCQVLVFRRSASEYVYAKSSPLLKVMGSVVRTFDGSYANVPGLMSGLMGLFAAACALLFVASNPFNRSWMYLCLYDGVCVRHLIVEPIGQGLNRTFAPYYPLAMIVFWTGAVYIVQSAATGFVGHKATRMLIYGMAGAVVVINIGMSAFHLRNIHKAPAMTSESLILPALWIRQFLRAFRCHCLRQDWRSGIFFRPGHLRFQFWTHELRGSFCEKGKRWQSVRH